jgi:hypothetical protein
VLTARETIRPVGRIKAKLATPEGRLAAAVLGAVLGVFLGLWVAQLAGVTGPVYWSQAIPTFVAVVAAVPAAIAINQLGEKSERETEEREIAARRRLALVAIRAELISALQISVAPMRPGQIRHNLLPTSSWDAMLGTQHLAALDDPDLISTLATVYFQISEANRIRHIAMSSVVGIGRQAPLDELVASMTTIETGAQVNIVKAIEALDAAEPGMGPRVVMVAAPPPEAATEHGSPSGSPAPEDE